MTQDNVVADSNGSNSFSFEDFIKADIRAGTIRKAEVIPKSNKLLKLEVSFGNEVGTRVIAAGIAKHYSPELAIGQRVLAVVNLPPRTLMGIESHGMILAAKDADGDVWLAACAAVDDGAKLG